MNRALVLDSQLWSLHRRRGNNETTTTTRRRYSPWSARRVDRERGIEACWEATAAPADSLAMAIDGNCDTIKRNCRYGFDNGHS